MSRYLAAALLLLTFVVPAVCAGKPVKTPPANPTVEYFSAISKGNVARVKSLVTADPKLLQAKSKEGKTGIQLAIAQNKPEIVALLRKNGALDEPPRIDIGVSCHYQQPKLSADGTKMELAKWIVRAEIKNADGHRWCVAPSVALFHLADKKPFLPVVTIPNQPSSVSAYDTLDRLWPWESFLVQIAPKEVSGRGFSSGISQWDLALAASDSAGLEGDLTDEEIPPWLADTTKARKPAPVVADYSFACTLTVDGKAGAWAETNVGPGQSLIADWESITLASPEELKRVGVADGASHDLTLVGPIVYDPDDPTAGAFVVMSRLTRPLSSSPEKFAAAEIVQLTSNYIEEQVTSGPTDNWKAFFVSLLWEQPRVMDNPDDLLIRTVQGYEKCGALAGGTAGVCLEQHKCTAAADGLVSIASNSKADAKMRARIIKGLYALDTTAVRDCLAAVAGNTAEPYIVRLLALNALAKCPQCDWAIVERFKEDKTLQGTASSLLAEHNKNTQSK